MKPTPTRLIELYEAARDIGQLANCDPSAVFDPLGLILEQPPLRDYYWCTPRTALTFATTGGDGVHYSYLPDANTSLGQEPIVMTMPANDTFNYVIAEGFNEFLGLGYHVGWFSLEQIAYQPKWAVEYFSAIEQDAGAAKRERLEALKLKLDIQYVPLMLERITELTEKYRLHLQVPEEPQ